MDRRSAGAAVEGHLPLAEELSAVFARMSGFLFSQETVATALGLVTSLAKDTIPGSVGSGVTLTDQRGRRTTAGASDAIVEEADNLQYEFDEGPCLDAWMHRTAVRVDDTATDERWRRWCPAASRLGMRSAEVGGDAFDYGLSETTASLAIFRRHRSFAERRVDGRRHPGRLSECPQRRP